MLIIDADAHVTEPRDVWTSRVATKDKDRVPHVMRTDDGTEVWVLDDVQIDRVGVSAAAGWPSFPYSYPPGLDECHPGAYRAKERLKYMDEAGIWAQVLYPNVAGFGAQRFLKMKDADLQYQCVRAYNDFIHEWSSEDPRRLIPNISLPFWDVRKSVAEIERCLDLGFRAILFTGEPHRFGFPILGSGHWDPLYSLAQDAGVPIHFHVGGGKDLPFSQDALRATRKEVYGVARANVVETVDLSLRNAVQCADLLSSGVLARFPSLKFVSVESGIGWLPFVLETADYAYLYGSPAGHKRSSSDLLPSELFRRQVYVTYWFEKVALQQFLDHLPIDHLLFETDFPHTACLYQNIQETISAGLDGVSEEVQRKLLWENSAALYGLDPPPSDAPGRLSLAATIS